ncbi:uncharacterized protein LOC116216015 [Punica granatum]|uniref:Uncharacterized protein LOC116216015 n=2 Tax=Punica granatum TaxID=22663 RepID=A0A6P8ERZ2_PUNGR|nr:uncharacterized protein LOC116216015 [Punica granatum]PKI65092.1 hypothetical protein CRG98_014561 [Punica granatum]
MIEERQGSSRPPYGVLLAVAIGAILMVPAVIGDGGEAVTEAISELLSPLGLLLAPVILVFTIRFLSSDRGSYLSNVFSAGEWDSSHMTGGTPIGGALFLVLTLVLLYSKVSIFGGDSGE